MSKEIHYSACALNCPDICAYKITVVDGEITRLEGDENHPYTLGRACPKGYGHILRHYSEDRLLHPKRKQSDGSFRTISWNEAFEEIADSIKLAIDNKGPSSVGIYSGSGNDGMAPRYAARFSHLIGTKMIPGIVEICFEGAYEGARFNVGPFPPHELSDWANSNCIVIWGTNKFESSIHSKRVIREAIENEAKLIVIDPRRIPHAKMADIYTTIRPGTDGALALGIANEIISRNLHDIEFIEENVKGFQRYKERASQYPKERVSKITWVRPDIIEKIAITFATHGPALISTAPAGMNHYTNGTWAARAVHSLLVICGYIGVSGGGFQYLSSDNSPFNGSAISLIEEVPRELKPVIPSGTYIPEFVLSQEECPLDILIIQAASPLTQWPNTKKAIDALDKIPLKVCIDQVMTDTAKHCDLVLPATTLFEHHNLVHSELHRIVQYAPKIVDPRGEAKHELEIWQGISDKLGIGDGYRITEIDAIRSVLDSEDCKDITLEKLVEKPEGIRTKSPAIPFADGNFNTPSGKIELYSETLLNKGFDPLPFYEEPSESPVSTPEVHGEYPLIMITGRLRERLHSQFTTLEVGGDVKSYSHCTSCQMCVKECPDEAIEMTTPNIQQMSQLAGEETVAVFRGELSKTISKLAVAKGDSHLSIPDEMTSFLIPKWNSKKCIGCRECELDVCPYDVVTQTINLTSRTELESGCTFLRIHPSTAKKSGLQDGDLVDVSSRRGRLEGIRLELDNTLDPRIVWSSDGWWNDDGNINLLTNDEHTAFGHTPGFNSVLVKIEKAKGKGNE